MINAADLRDMLLDALDQAGPPYEVLERCVDANVVADVAAAKVRINGRTFTIMVREDGE